MANAAQRSRASNVNAVARNRYARLLTNGVVDTAFNPGQGADSTVYSIALLPSGDIILGGDFTLINGFARRGVARLFGDNVAAMTPPQFATSLQFTNGAFTANFSALAGRTYVIEGSADLFNWTPLGTNMAASAMQSFTDPSPPGNYRFYRARLLSP